MAGVARFQTSLRLRLLSSRYKRNSGSIFQIIPARNRKLLAKEKIIISAQLQLETWTEQEYWDLEEKSEVRHEFINGVPYAMAGGTLNHAKICLNVASAAKARLRGKRCEAASSELKVKVEATGNSFYPDATIYCPPARFAGKGDHTLLTPTVLFEVLSPKTKEFNRSGKMAFYQKIETLTDYVLVDSEHISVEHWSREGIGEDWRWRLYTKRSESVKFPRLEIELPLEEIYEDLEMLDDWVERRLAQANEDD